MENAAFMGCAKRPPNLSNYVCGAPEIHSFGSKQRSKTAAINVLHHDIGFAVRHLTGVEDADNAGMIDTRQRFHLLLEFLKAPFVSRFCVVQAFHDHRA